MGPGILPSLEEGAQSNPGAQAPPRRKGIKTLDTLDRVRTDAIRFALMNLGDPCGGPRGDRPRSMWSGIRTGSASQEGAPTGSARG